MRLRMVEISAGVSARNRFGSEPNRDGAWIAVISERARALKPFFSCASLLGLDLILYIPLWANCLESEQISLPSIVSLLLLLHRLLHSVGNSHHHSVDKKNM